MRFVKVQSPIFLMKSISMAPGKSIRSVLADRRASLQEPGPPPRRTEPRHHVAVPPWLPPGCGSADRDARVASVGVSCPGFCRSVSGRLTLPISWSKAAVQIRKWSCSERANSSVSASSRSDRQRRDQEPDGDGEEGVSIDLHHPGRTTGVQRDEKKAREHEKPGEHGPHAG